jgi:C-terminal processing protease CtpA/Prc
MAAALLVAALCVPAHAGSMGKCGYDTQTCLNGFAAMRETHGWVGLKTDKNDAGEMVVKTVYPDSPAAAAGIAVGDVLVSVNGASMTDVEAVKKASGDWKVGQSVTYALTRGGVAKEVTLTLARMPDDVFAAMVGEHMLSDHVTATATKDASAEGKPAK